MFSWVTGGNISLGCGDSGKLGFKLKPAKDSFIISRVFSAAHQTWISASTLHNHSRSVALFSPFCTQSLCRVSLFWTPVLYQFLPDSSPLGQEEIYTKQIQVIEPFLLVDLTRRDSLCHGAGEGCFFPLNFLILNLFRIYREVTKSIISCNKLKVTKVPWFP